MRLQVFGSVVGGLDTLAQAELISCGAKDVRRQSALHVCVIETGFVY